MEGIRNQRSKLSATLAVIAFVLQFVGFVSPGWYIVETLHTTTLVMNKYSYGVWYVIHFDSDNGWETSSLTSKGKCGIIISVT